jgi:pyruvate,orthophosphate dikinase
MMENSFSSKALEVNLAETRYKETVIPGEHLWFMSLSSSHWGIHKRTQDFILEYNHQYVNYEYVIDNLHDISLTDFWFYNACEEPGRALMVIVGIFDNLVSIELKQSSREKLILNLLKFADQLSRQEKIHEQILSLCLTILRNGIRKDDTIYIQNSNYFKIYLSRTACIPLFSQEVFDLTRSLVQRSIDFWESSSNMEQWFEEK